MYLRLFKSFITEEKNEIKQLMYPTQKLFHHPIIFCVVLTHDGYNPKSDLYILS